MKHGTLLNINRLANKAYLMKKVMVTLLALSTFGTVLTAPLIANAFEINIGGHHFSDKGYRSDHQYAVFFRKHHHDGWKLKGNYGSRYEAEYALRQLQDNGYLARIQQKY
jgi:hypothetical protein